MRFSLFQFVAISAVIGMSSLTTPQINADTFYGRATQDITILSTDHGGALGLLVASLTGNTSDDLQLHTIGLGYITATPSAPTDSNGTTPLSFTDGVFSGTYGPQLGPFQFGNIHPYTADAYFNGSLTSTGAFTLNGLSFAFVLEALPQYPLITDAFTFTSATPPAPGVQLVSIGRLNAYIGGDHDLLAGYSENRVIDVLASPVPEPSSFALLGLGGLGLAFGAYRRRCVTGI